MKVIVVGLATGCPPFRMRVSVRVFDFKRVELNVLRSHDLRILCYARPRCQCITRYFISAGGGSKWSPCRKQFLSGWFPYLGILDSGSGLVRLNDHEAVMVASEDQKPGWGWLIVRAFGPVVLISVTLQVPVNGVALN